MNKAALLLIVTVILAIITTKLFFPQEEMDVTIIKEKSFFSSEEKITHYQFYPAFDAVTKVIEALLLIMIARSGTTIKTVYFRVILFFLGLYMIGFMYKIMHWPGAAMMLSVPLMGIAITYVLRTINKKQPSTLDIFKALWVVSTTVESILRLLHLVKREYLIMSDLIGWFLILFFVVTEYKKGLLEK